MVLGNKYVKVFSAICFIIKVFIVIFYGFYLVLSISYGAGQEIGTNKDLVALYFLRFVAIREICLLPTIGVRQYFKTLTEQLKKEEQAGDRKLNSGKKAVGFLSGKDKKQEYEKEGGSSDEAEGEGA